MCVSLAIWDTAGQERFHALAPIYYRDSNAAILVLDITDEKSFQKVQHWVEELHKIVGKDIVLFIAANKIDLESKRQVNSNDIDEYAHSVNAQVIQTSAKSGKGVHVLFLELTKALLKQAVNSNRSEIRRNSRARQYIMTIDDSFALPKKKTIGLAVGGARDCNNFRKCIEEGYMPAIGSITYNGLLYEYNFDTKTVKHLIDDENKQEQEDITDNASMLFYPSYSYAKCKKLNYENQKADKYDYYLSVGLNSNINQDAFKRKHLNLIIVLDKSGSMGSCFNDANNF
eukprot:11054_1